MSGETLYLTQRDLNPNYVRIETLTHQGHIILEDEVSQGRGGLETRCDVLIQGLWAIQTKAIIDVRLGYPECDSYKKEPMVTILDLWEK